MGGDWWTPEIEAATEPTWDAIVAGIRSTGASEPMTYHTGGFMSSWLMFSDREWVDFLSPETSHCLLPDEAQGVLTMLKATFGKDVVSAEMRYEDEPTQARGVSAWCYPEGPAVGFIGAPEIAADALASYNAGAVAYVYGHDTRWNWGNWSATLGQPGEAAAMDVAQDGMLGGDTTAPGWPGNAWLNGTATDTSVSLTWGAASDDTGVALHRVSESARGIMGRAVGRTATISGLQPGTSYSFTVEAVDAAGNTTPGPQFAITTSGQPPGDRVALFDVTTGRWHLRHSADDDRWFYYGNPGDVPLMGDWDGDGDDTPGMYRPSTGFAYLTNQLPADGSAVVADPGLSFFFGIPGDQVLSGDWDGDGIDTLGIRRGDKMFLAAVNATSPAAWEFYFGVEGDIAVGGDADGDGGDSVFLYRPSNGFVYFTNAIPGGTSAAAATSGTLFFGQPSDRFIVGDWDANGNDTVGVFRPTETAFYLRNSNTTGPGDVTFAFGQSEWLPAVGHF
ncbi:MAG: DUF4038 domain-containing protein, partial [Acidimicrobiia bacterium]|nr:DUF4038 domain-containing protein [Acidimicrobiia bacterium]